MSTITLETDHFFIEYCHWNEGTRWPCWHIQAKTEKTDKSRAALPPLASSYTGALSLVPFLHEAEAWYMRNKLNMESHEQYTYTKTGVKEPASITKAFNGEKA